jgi:hypothetical protein
MDTKPMETRNERSILADVTSFISAQDYIISIFNKRPNFDPFAQQSYAELIQSILIYDNIYVPHPTILSNCAPEDFGREPKLLSLLLEKGIVAPLNIENDKQIDYKNAEDEIDKWLRTHGADKISEYISITEHDEMLRKAQKSNFDGNTVSRLSEWCEFHLNNIRHNNNHHKSRISTKDGIEDDGFGEFARGFSSIFREKYNPIFKGQLDYLVATIMRALRYQTRANICGIAYQPHVMRRDFVLGCNIELSDLPKDYANELIKLIHGIYDELKKYSNPFYQKRVKVLRYNIPLLCGKLWNDTDKDMYKDSCLEYVTSRLEEYKSKCAILRDQLRKIYSDEDFYKLEGKFEETKSQLFEACGILSTKLTEVDNMLLEGGSAVVDSIPGVPNMKGILINAASLLKKKFFFKSNPAQQFVFQEFLKGWKGI